jgi:CRISPR-associated protein Csx17
MALRLACLPWKLDDIKPIGADESILRRLMAGDGSTAVETAVRRLRAAGLRPPLQGASADAATARRWAAALAFPISRDCAHAMALYFEPINQEKIR